MVANGWKRGLALSLCFLETALLGSAIYGWPSLVYVLQADELYIDRCLQNQDAMIGSVINNSLPALNTFGINFTRTARHYSSGNIIDLRDIENISTVIFGLPTTSVTTGASISMNNGETTVNAGDVADSNNNVSLLDTVRCNEQKVALSLSYTVAIVSFGVSALPMGFFFDRFGLRMTRTITVLLGILGYCQLAFAKRGMEWLILTGAVFTGPSCYTLLITNFHVAKLAGKRSSLAVAIYAAGMTSSFAYQLVKTAHDAGLTRMVALLTLASLWLVVLFTSWCLLPKFKVDDKEFGGLTQNKIATNPGSGQAEEQSLWKYITSATYVTFLFWFCAGYTRHNMIISGYDSWITEIAQGDLGKVTFYTDILAYGTLAGSLLTPINGIITDFMFAKYSHGPGGKSLTMLPAALVSSIIMTLVNIPLLFDTETAIYSAVLLFMIAKPLFLSTPAIFMSIVPPRQHYGVVFGILNVAGGVASFMVYPYLMWAAAVHSNIPVTIFILVSNILALSFPLMLYYDRWTEVRGNGRMREEKVTMWENINTQQGTIPKSLQQATTDLQENTKM